MTPEKFLTLLTKKCRNKNFSAKQATTLYW